MSSLRQKKIISRNVLWKYKWLPTWFMICKKRVDQIWWRDFACEKSSIWLFETPSLDSHDTLYKFQQSSLCYRSISTSLCQGPFSGGVCYISHKRLFLMTKKLHETTAKTIKLLYRIFEKSFPNYPAFTTTTFC